MASGRREEETLGGETVENVRNVKERWGTPSPRPPA